MVEIQCPHCDAVVELDDGVSGTFSCLNCESSIEWGNTVSTAMRTPVSYTHLTLPTKA